MTCTIRYNMGKIQAHTCVLQVDREERPDVDRVYMTFVQVIGTHCKLQACLQAHLGLALFTLFSI